MHSNVNMVFKLYGAYCSPAILLEKKVSFEIVPVDMANGQHKSLEYIPSVKFLTLYVTILFCQYSFDSLNLLFSL